MKISICMIVKDEEAVLERCLKCAERVADELIIVDTGSSDNTKNIAKKFTGKVYDFEWVDDFSKARNFSFSKASMDYVMWLDADDIILDEDIEKLNKLKRENSAEPDIIYLKYNTGFDQNGKVTFSYYRERIIKNCPLAIFKEPIHEAIAPFGKLQYSDIAITHKKLQANEPERNLKIFEKQIKNGTVLSPRLQYYYGRELMQNGKIKKAAVVFEKFLKEKNGWIENKISACKDLSGCYKLLEENEKSIKALLQSLSLCSPRPEISCSIGQYFYEAGDYPSAVFWYKAALDFVPEPNSLSFIENDYFEFIPAIQLSVLYDKLKDIPSAVYYNELAGKFKPEHPSYLHNKKYFLTVG